MSIHPYSGCSKIVLHFEPSTLTHMRSPELVLFVSCPRQPYLFVRLSAVAQAQGQEKQVRFISSTSFRKPEEFQPKVDGLLAEVNRHPADIQTDFRTSQHWCMGKVSRSQSIVITVAVDTESRSFLEHVSKLRADLGLRATAKLVVPLTIYGYSPEELDSAEVKVHLEPLTTLPEFQGCVSLDLGNTSTSVCSLLSFESPDQLQSLPDVSYDYDIGEKSLRFDNATIQSILRVERVPDLNLFQTRSEALKQLKEPRQIKWEVGISARAEQSDVRGLVIGPKRLLARHDCAEHVIASTDIVTDKPIDTSLPCTLPAELYVCRLLQMFRAIKKSSPNCLAITYPTTYSPLEIDRTKQAIHQAWERLERREGQVRLAANDLIALDLDEASAAAFNTVCRLFLSKPGALDTFRYYYPNGFHLLLFDCGGGTTDLALVRVNAMSMQNLQVSVLGRSGVREFGGDDITEAVYKVMKYRLAEKLIEYSSTKIPALPSCDNNRKDFLAALNVNGSKWADVNRVFPTAFDPMRIDPHRSGRMRLVLSFWEWAETAKRAFVDPIGGPTGFKSEVSRTLPKSDGITDFLRDQYKLGSESALELLSTVRISKQEVICQIEDKVRQCIDCCNALIRSKLHNIRAQPTSGRGADYPLQPTSVDCVSIVGNGSRFPYILEEIQSRIQVPYLTFPIDATEP